MSKHSPSSYIAHHLHHLQAHVLGFSFNLDTIFWSSFLAILIIVVLYRYLPSLTIGVPGRFQAAFEILVESINEQANILNKNPGPHISALGFTVFLWVLLMNAMDLLPVDMIGKIAWGFNIHYMRVVPTADLNLTLGMSIGVMIIAMYYGIKAKGWTGVLKTYIFGPFGKHPLLILPNILLNIIELIAKTVSLAMRLFGNMYAGEFLFLLIAILGSYRRAEGVLAQILIGTGWAIFHILIVVLQAFIFMMLTLVYIGQSQEEH